MALAGLRRQFFEPAFQPTPHRFPLRASAGGPGCTPARGRERGRERQRLSERQRESNGLFRRCRRGTTLPTTSGRAAWRRLSQATGVCEAIRLGATGWAVGVGGQPGARGVGYSGRWHTSSSTKTLAVISRISVIESPAWTWNFWNNSSRTFCSWEALAMLRQVREDTQVASQSGEVTHGWDAREGPGSRSCGGRCSDSHGRVAAGLC